MRNEDRIRLQHMLDAAQDALSFAEGRTREDLETDRQLVRAVVAELLQVDSGCRAGEV